MHLCGYTWPRRIAVGRPADLPRGDQDGYKRFQQPVRRHGRSAEQAEQGRSRKDRTTADVLHAHVWRWQAWEARRHGPAQHIWRQQLARSEVMSPEQLHRHVRDLDGKLLADPPLWMGWRSPTQVQLLLRSRGAAVVDLLPPAGLEVARIHTDDNVIGCVATS